MFFDSVYDYLSSATRDPLQVVHLSFTIIVRRTRYSLLPKTPFDFHPNLTFPFEIPGFSEGFPLLQILLRTTLLLEDTSRFSGRSVTTVALRSGSSMMGGVPWF